jgi:hypothetical protein
MLLYQGLSSQGTIWRSRGNFDGMVLEIVIVIWLIVDLLSVFGEMAPTLLLSLAVKEIVKVGFGSLTGWPG